MDPVIDVIVPVYRGYEQTRRCLNSLLAAPQRTPFELIVIDDASPEPEIRSQLDDLAASGRIHLHRHTENQGFVASVNAAMALHPQRDLVLLNSDTEVANDWLDRLVFCAQSEPCIATVTPLSNDATICSYPRIGETNPMPDDGSVAELDALAAAVNAGQSIDIPTGVGFCLLIRRETLDAIGLFDQERFGRGYGEEVDFCLRAEQLGYRHLLTGNVFVYHQGQVSFGEGAAAQKRRAQALIDAEYPDYPERISAFFANDAGRPLRRRLDLARLRCRSPLLLFICHDRGAGVQRHVTDLTEIVKDRTTVLLLLPHGHRRQRLLWCDQREEFEAFVDLADDYQSALSFLRELGIDHLHYHHVADFPQEVMRLARDLNLPYDFTVHDYAPMCPHYHLSDAQGRYCGEAGLAACDSCLQERPAQWPLDIAAWRELWYGWLTGAARIICPSEDVQQRIERYWPELPTLCWPHPQVGEASWGRTPFTRRSHLKVLVLGAISPIKGLNLLEACALDARERGLPLFFRVLGPSVPPKYEWPDAPLSIAGSYQDAELPDLIALERPDVFFFPAQWPETFSYTLTVAMQTGLPIVATAIGAFIERLSGYLPGSLLPIDAAPTECNQRLLAAQPRFALPALQTPFVDVTSEHYADRYLEAIASADSEFMPAPRSVDAQPIRRWFDSNEDFSPQRSLSSLYSAVVDYRDRRLQPELSQRIEQTELTLADAQWERRELKQQLCESEAYALTHQKDERRAFTRHTDHLQARLDASEAQIIAIKNSTTWRLIQPLHDLVGALRQPQASTRIWRALIQRLGPKHRYSQNPGFAFPAPEHPLVSLILGPIDDPVAVPACLWRMYTELQGLEIEVLLLEDAAGILSAQLQAAGISGLTLIPDVHPPHFGQQANQAAAQARGPYLLWLDPAVAIDRAAVDAMLEQLQQPGVGIVVPKICTPDPDGCLVAAGGILWQDGSVWCDGAGDDPAKPEFNYIRRIDVAPWGCLVVASELLKSVGGFDHQSTEPDVSAVRLCLTISVNGMAVVYAAAASVILDYAAVRCEGGKSCLSPTQKDSIVNQWGQVVRNRFTPGERLREAREPFVQERILIIATESRNTVFSAEIQQTWLIRISSIIRGLLGDSDRYRHKISIVPWAGWTSDSLAPFCHRLEELESPFVIESQDAICQYGVWSNYIVFFDPFSLIDLVCLSRSRALNAKLVGVFVRESSLIFDKNIVETAACKECRQSRLELELLEKHLDMLFWVDSCDESLSQVSSADSALSYGSSLEPGLWPWVDDGSDES